jgi:hypothetical protein
VEVKMSVTLSSEDQLVADLGERRDEALRLWRDLVKARAEYFARIPAMTAEGRGASGGRRRRAYLS